MSNQAVQDIERFAVENDFELQISLERAFAQLEGDDSNAQLIKDLEALTLRAQNQSIQNIAAKVGIGYDETKAYLSEGRKRLVQYPPIQWCWEELKAQNESVSLKKISTISDKEEQNWIDLLAGQSVPNADQKTVYETQIFRAALLSHSEKPKNASEIPYPHILENVLSRLETEGLLKKTRQSGLEKLRLLLTLRQPKHNTQNNHAPPWYRNPVNVFAFTIFFIGVVVVLPRLYHLDPAQSEEPSGTTELMTSKGGSSWPCPDEIIVSQPHTEANHLKKELEAHSGVIATITPIKKKRIKEGWRLNATLPAERTMALKELLQHYDLYELVESSNDLCVNIISKEPT